MTEIEVSPEHAHDPKSRIVGIQVALIGILLSVVTIASHRSHTQAVIERTQVNDDWAFYQAKKIRAATSEAALSILQALGTDPAKTAEAAEKLKTSRDKEIGDTRDLEVKAHESEAKTALEERRALRYDIGEGLLELGLVLSSLYFLSRNAFFPVIGLVAAIGGTALGIAGWTL
jgi:uncharacterized membrane protein